MGSVLFFQDKPYIYLQFWVNFKLPYIPRLSGFVEPNLRIENPWIIRINLYKVSPFSWIFVPRTLLTYYILK